MAGLPTPEDLWGDSKIDGLDEQHTILWNLWLRNLAILIIFAKQDVIDRVSTTIKDNIAKAKSGEITATVALWNINPQRLIYQDEWEDINAAAKKDGRIIGQIYFGNLNKNIV